MQQVKHILEKDELEWKDENDEKSPCPKLTPESQTKFAERTRQIATDVDKNRVNSIVQEISNLVM